LAPPLPAHNDPRPPSVRIGTLFAYPSAGDDKYENEDSMISIKKILYPTDFSRCAGQAFAHAVHLARRHGAELHISHVTVLHDDDPHNAAHHFPEVQDVLSHLEDLAHQDMAAVLREYHVRDLETKCINVRASSAAPAILEYAEDNDIDLIVTGTHGRRGLKHLFLGSVAEEVVRLSNCPVLTLREREEPQPVAAMTRILVPIDFSEHSRRALVHAKWIASWYNARLDLLHVIEEQLHPAFYGTGRTSIFEVMPDIRTKSKEKLGHLLEDTPGPNVMTESYVIGGRASGDIVEFAKANHSDLIVIATHGLTGIRSLLLGSVTEKVVRMAPCPVLTTKPFGKSLVSEQGA